MSLYDDEPPKMPTDFINRIVMRQALDKAQREEAGVRAYLIGRISRAIFDDTRAWTSADFDRMAEIAVDTLADCLREFA